MSDRDLDFSLPSHSVYVAVTGPPPAKDFNSVHEENFDVIKTVPPSSDANRGFEKNTVLREPQLKPHKMTGVKREVEKRPFLRKGSRKEPSALHRINKIGNEELSANIQVSDNDTSKRGHNSRITGKRFENEINGYRERENTDSLVHREVSRNVGDSLMDSSSVNIDRELWNKHSAAEKELNEFALLEQQLESLAPPSTLLPATYSRGITALSPHTASLRPSLSTAAANSQPVLTTTIKESTDDYAGFTNTRYNYSSDVYLEVEDGREQEEKDEQGQNKYDAEYEDTTIAWANSQQPRRRDLSSTANVRDSVSSTGLSVGDDDCSVARNPSILLSGGYSTRPHIAYDDNKIDTRGSMKLPEADLIRTRPRISSPANSESRPPLRSSSVASSLSSSKLGLGGSAVGRHGLVTRPLSASGRASLSTSSSAAGQGGGHNDSHAARTHSRPASAAGAADREMQISSSSSSVDPNYQDIAKKAKELESELETYKRENEAVKQLRKKQEVALAEVLNEKNELLKWVSNERSKTETWCNEQRAAIARERRAAAKLAKENAAVITGGGGSIRKEKIELDGLRTTMEKMKLDFENERKRLKANELRLRQLVKDQAKSIEDLQSSVDEAEKNLLSMWSFVDKLDTRIPSNLLRTRAKKEIAANGDRAGDRLVRRFASETSAGAYVEEINIEDSDTRSFKSTVVSDSALAASTQFDGAEDDYDKGGPLANAIFKSSFAGSGDLLCSSGGIAIDSRADGNSAFETSISAEAADEEWEGDRDYAGTAAASLSWARSSRSSQGSRSSVQRYSCNNNDDGDDDDYVGFERYDDRQEGGNFGIHQQHARTSSSSHPSHRDNTVFEDTRQNLDVLAAQNRMSVSANARGVGPVAVAGDSYISSGPLTVSLKGTTVMGYSRSQDAVAVDSRLSATSLQRVSPSPSSVASATAPAPPTDSVVTMESALTTAGTHSSNGNNNKNNNDSNYDAAPSRTEEVMSDGRRVVRYRNGTVKETLPDGRSVVRFTNGDIKRTNPELGTVTYFYAEAKTMHTTYKDGLEVYEFPNKQVEKHYSDGRKEILFPDSTQKFIGVDGTQESHFPDGIIVREYPDGKKEIVSNQYRVSS